MRYFIVTASSQAIVAALTKKAALEWARNSIGAAFVPQRFKVTDELDPPELKKKTLPTTKPKFGQKV